MWRDGVGVFVLELSFVGARGMVFFVGVGGGMLVVGLALGAVGGGGVRGLVRHGARRHECVDVR